VKALYQLFKKKLMSLLKFAVCSLLFLMTADVFTGVIFRYVLKKPLVWVDELALISAVWLALLGASVVYEDNQHLCVDFLMERLSERGKVRLELIINILIMPLFVVMLRGGLALIGTTYTSITPGLKVSVAIEYLPAFIGGSLLLLFNVEKIINNIKTLSLGK
jgi:TRAP-type C4-dicarboxylate transport system permease small subunit